MECMKQIDTYVTEHTQRFLDELCEFLRIPSVSTDATHAADIDHAAHFVRLAFDAAGADTAEVMKTDGHPVVYAEKIIDATLPTVLVYGHYDVQPPDPLEEWKTPPFEPTIRDEQIYARGATDDKGQVYMHIKAFEAMVATNSLPCNVKFLIEGEEELGSPSLEAFCRTHKKLLAADAVLASDTAIISKTVPSIETGLRGLCYFEVTVEALSHDLHSGIYGGAVPNPATILARMIASLHNAKGKVTIPHFYDDVATVSKAERAKMNARPHSDAAYRREVGAKALEGEVGYTTIERTTIRPTLEVNGIWGGFTGTGSKTIVPARAHAKISTRLVPNQSPEKMAKLVMQHLKRSAPPSVTVTVRQLDGVGKPYVTPTDSAVYRAAAAAMKETFGKEPIPTRSGGSIPVICMFDEVLGTKSALMGFGFESDGLHSPNEHFGVWNFFKGIQTIPRFYAHFTTLSRE